MQVTLELPDNLALALSSQGNFDLSRRALEALALEGYRENLLSQRQVGELLHLSRIQTEDFIASHLALYDYDPAELTRETDQLKHFSEHSR